LPFISYENADIALNCGMMLRECVRVQELAEIILRSADFYKFFDYVQKSTFDIASDAFATFKVCLSILNLKENCIISSSRE
jgi:calcium binding protein 39